MRSPRSKSVPGTADWGALYGGKEPRPSDMRLANIQGFAVARKKLHRQRKGKHLDLSKCAVKLP